LNYVKGGEKVEILEFIKEWWVLITAFLGELGVLWGFVSNINKSTKCTLRNDILDIYDRCKESGKITHYQLQSIMYSYDRYKKLKGNSFVDEIIVKVQNFELVD
jgi:hypothetical protein